MRWVIQPGSPICAANLPQVDIDDCVGVVGSIGDCRGFLLAGETNGIHTWVEKRQLEYSTGRHFAHLAMQALGVTPMAIERQADRSPIWPAQFLGSIAHCDDAAIALVALASACRGLGVDIERRGRIGSDLFAALFTAHEQGAIGDGASATELFCAKEALYKAVHPLVQTFINFTDVSLVNHAVEPVDAMYLGAEHSVSGFVADAEFSKRLTAKHACVVAWLPHSAASEPMQPRPANLHR